MAEIPTKKYTLEEKETYEKYYEFVTHTNPF